MLQRLKLFKDLLGLYLNRRQAKELLAHLQASNLSDADRDRVSHILKISGVSSESDTVVRFISNRNVSSPTQAEVLTVEIKSAQEVWQLANALRERKL